MLPKRSSKRSATAGAGWLTEQVIDADGGYRP